MKEIGDLGEDLVARWLRGRGDRILERGWRCRWGEIDIVAIDKTTKTLAFVEVKTRSHNNWDEFGLLAITPQKQQKIIKTASLFFSRRNRFADFGCRFDVALVSYENYNPASSVGSIDNNAIAIGKPIIWQDRYRVILRDYIQDAFSLD